MKSNLRKRRSTQRISGIDLEARAANLRLLVFDFDGVFTDNMVYVFEDGREAVRCSRFDGIGLRRLESAGVEPIIVSTETNPVVSKRAKKLAVECIQGVAKKLDVVTNLVVARGITFEAVGFVGNDVNDFSCLSRVGLPIVVADAHRDVIDIAAYVTSAPGGHGAVREICDLIAGFRGVPSSYLSGH